MTPEPRGFGARLRSSGSASLGSQLVSSASNFALLALVARGTGPADYALFSGALAAWVLLLGVSRALVVEPMVLRAARDHDALAHGHRAGLRLAMAAGALVGLIALVMQLVDASVDVRRTTAALALVLPGLVVQDLARWHFIARRRGGPALLGEVVFAVVELGLAGTLLARDELTVVTGLLSVGAGAAVSALVLSVLMTLPVPAAPAEGDRLPGWLLVDFLCTWLNGQASLFVVAAVVAAADAGALRAANDLFGPLRVVQVSLLVLLLPAGAAALTRSGGVGRLTAQLWRAGAVAVGVSTCYCVLAVVAGRALLTSLYGEAFEPSTSLLVLLAVGTLLQTAQTVQLIGLKALRQARALAWFRLTTTPPGLLLLVVLVHVDGARGAATAIAVAGAVRVALLVRVLQRAAADPDATPDDGNDGNERQVAAWSGS